MSFYLFLLLVILIKCSEKVDEIKNNERKLQSDQSDEYESIRLFIDTKCLLTSENNTDLELIKKSIEIAKETIEKLVKVKRIKQPIYLPNYGIRRGSDIHLKFEGCCDNSFLMNSLPADLIIFVREYSSFSDGDVEFALSGTVKYENNDAFGRPIVGTISYKHNVNKLYDDNSKIQALSTIFLHEITHILGFNKTVFENKKIIYTDTNAKMRMNNNHTTKYYINGAHTLERARKYFNCPTLQGVELDHLNGDEAKDGSNIHWSERILKGDYMGADLNYYAEQAISEITLALLEDLGDWYKVNYYTGGLMRFGKNIGCDFFTKDCIEYISSDRTQKSLFRNEFCSNFIEGSDSFGTCTSGRQSLTDCSNKDTNSNIFSESLVAKNSLYYRDGLSSRVVDGYSPSRIIEFCPFSDSDTNTGKDRFYNYDGNCKIGHDGKDHNFIIEEYSEISFCAFSSLLRKGIEQAHVKNILRPTCYKMSCSDQSLTVHISNEFIVCPREGGIIKIDSIYSNFTGYLICPDYNLICTGTKVCNNIFDCAKNESLVKESTYDYDYTINQNVSIEIFDKLDTSDAVTNNINTNTIYELGENGVCPKYCKQCKENKQCTICDPTYNNYIGKKEGDNEELKCSKDEKSKGYYNFTDDNGKKFFYECIDNCDL